MPELLSAISNHLQQTHAPIRFKVTGQTRLIQRRIYVSVISAPGIDLLDPDKRSDLITSIADEVWRFSYDRSNHYTDLVQVAFQPTVEISPTYWANRQRTEGQDLIADKLKVSAFRRAIRPGNILEVIKPDDSAGRRHRVLEVATRILTDNGIDGAGHFYWDFPLSEAFLCDGELIRISKGNTNRPHDYQLLRWIR